MGKDVLRQKERSRQPKRRKERKKPPNHRKEKVDPNFPHNPSFNMSFLSDINTSTAEPSELALFTDPPNQVAVQKIYFSETRPFSSFDADDAPLEFAVPGSGNKYLDL
jgi:hypothetical protein